MISDTINEIKKIEIDGATKIKNAQENVQKRTKETSLHLKEKNEKQIHEITKECERIFVQERAKIDYQQSLLKKQAENECVKLKQDSNFKIEKAVSFIERKIFEFYKIEGLGS